MATMANEELTNGSLNHVETVKPPKAFTMDEHFEFIDIVDDKSSNAYLLLGASNIAMQDWTGGLWYYDDPELAPRPEMSTSSLPTFCPNGAGEFINHKKCIVGNDDGFITIFKINKSEESLQFKAEPSYQVGSSSITSLSLSPHKSKTAVAFGQDIYVLENENLYETKRYPGAHVRNVTCVNWGPLEDLFVSTSNDQSAILWDIRQSKPALAIYEDEIFALKSATWVNPNEVVIGSLSGEILVVDVRTLSSSAKIPPLQDKPVHKFRQNHSTGALATCYDSNRIIVFDKKYQIIYSDESHQRVVRGLAWHPFNGQLYSCGFDGKIVRHDLPKM